MANPAKQLIEAGFVLEVIEGGGLGVTPRAKLTDEWSRFIRANKPQILASLIEAANDGDLIEAPAPNPYRLDGLPGDGIPTAPDWQGLPDPDEPGVSRAERFRRLSERYFLHSMECDHCCAAGRGYGARCDVGQPLWAATQSAPVPWSHY